MLTLAALAALLLAVPADPRASYDVQAYRLDLRVDPKTKTLTGTVAVDAVVSDAGIAKLVLDLQPPFEVQSVVDLAAALEPEGKLDGPKLAFERKDSSLEVFLAAGRKKGDAVRVAVAYSGKPREDDAFDGFHWKKTADGRPWIATSCQGTGSSAWWPCKDSFWHPEDKPERTFVNLTVPDGLFGVSNGRLTGREKAAEGLETFHWVHEYPCETYAIAINVAPYVVSEIELEVPGAEGEPALKIPFATYVLPEDKEKAALQFAEVPEMLEAYSRAFGPYPFPKSKFGLVQANFLGMEHSTCVAYGSTFPAWARAHGKKDANAGMNARLDYILVHESAHEWWGNAVSARSWGHFWIHEGFATYAELVYLEETQDAEAVEAHLASMRASIGPASRLFRGENVDSEAAYGHDIYFKGAWVLHTLRGFVDDDEAWWKSLRDFNLEFRYRNADTEDFRAVLERNTKKPWKEFFDEWFYGEGYPIVAATVTTRPKSILVQAELRGSGKSPFHLPFSISWREGQAKKEQRLVLEPGRNEVEIPCASKPRDVAASRLEGVLCEATVQVL